MNEETETKKTYNGIALKQNGKTIAIPFSDHNAVTLDEVRFEIAKHVLPLEQNPPANPVL